MADAPGFGPRAFVLRRDAVVVTGPDAVTYLQGQLSQDVAALEVGASAWSWLLQPAGKVDALVRVTRTGPEALLVDVDEGFGEVVLNRLKRFLLRTKAELVPGAVAVVALRGPGAGSAAAEVASSAGKVELQGGDVTPTPDGEAWVVEALWPSAEAAADVLYGDGTGIVLPAASIGADRWEAERIAAGVPAMGAELTDKTIPAETGLVDSTASFTKGCYTGQELVARIDSRGGNVPRHLRRLRAAAALTPGDELTNADGKVVGTVTSAAVSPDAASAVEAGAGAGVGAGAGADGQRLDGQTWVALAYLARSVGADDPVTSAAGPVTVLPAGAP